MPNTTINYVLLSFHAHTKYSHYEKKKVCFPWHYHSTQTSGYKPHHVATLIACCLHPTQTEPHTRQGQTRPVTSIFSGAAKTLSTQPSRPTDRENTMSNQLLPWMEPCIRHPHEISHGNRTLKASVTLLQSLYECYIHPFRLYVEK